MSLYSSRRSSHLHLSFICQLISALCSSLIRLFKVVTKLFKNYYKSRNTRLSDYNLVFYLKKGKYPFLFSLSNTNLHLRIWNSLPMGHGLYVLSPRRYIQIYGSKNGSQFSYSACSNNSYIYNSS